MFKKTELKLSGLQKRVHKFNDSQLNSYINFMKNNTDQLSLSPQMKPAAEASKQMLLIGQNELVRRKQNQAALGNFLEKLSTPKASITNWLNGSAKKLLQPLVHAPQLAIDHLPLRK